MIARRVDQAFKYLLGLAVVVGLIGAFVQLGRSSLWYDELFTAWVTTADAVPAHVFGRLVTDLHPPVYYVSTYLWSLLFGTGDAALRSYSALSACGAVLIVFFGLKRSMSLNGRLVACALAVGSRYWFYMAQNARSYALCMLIGAVLLWLASELLTNRERRWPLAALFITATLGAFSHFFMTFEAVGLCLLLALYLPRRRIALVAFSAALVIANALYVKLVINHFARFSITNTWMSNDPGAYADNLLDALKFTGLKEVAILALLVVIGFGLWRLIKLGIAAAKGGRPSPKAFGRRLVERARIADPFFVICLAVPPLVFLFSVLSSLIRPNFSPQNFLVCAPFLWCAVGRIYQHWTRNASPRRAIVIDVCFGLFLLAMAPVVAGRFVERNEPWKDSAVDVRRFEACHGQVIPVVSEDGPYLRDPHYPDLYQGFLYGHYLDGFASTAIFEHLDIANNHLPDAVRAVIAARLKGQGCPIVAWDAHTDTNDYDDALMPELVAAAGPLAPGYHIAKLEYPWYDKVLMGKTTGNPGFILYVRQDTPPAK